MSLSISNTNIKSSKPKKRIFFALYFLCILGSLSVLPYSLHVNLFSTSVPFIQHLFWGVIHSAVLFGVACILSYVVVPKTDLFPFQMDKPLKRIVYPALITGISVGLILYLLTITLFKSSQLNPIHTPAWTGILASFYGAINEEVLLRLFLFSSIYFLFKKTFKFQLKSRTAFLWVTNSLVALAFGAAHLPAAYKLMAPSSFEIFRILLLNGIAGLAFGWLYWSRGLWAAMAAHYVVDLVIHVFLN